MKHLTPELDSRTVYSQNESEHKKEERVSENFLTGFSYYFQ